MVRKTQKQTKTQTKKQSKKVATASRTSTLPTGFKVIGRAPNWEYEKYKLVTGTRGETHTIIMDKGKKTEREVRNFILQDEDAGAITIWESSMLKDLFDQTEDGDEISIEFLGFGEARKGQQPPKLFSCGIKE